MVRRSGGIVCVGFRFRRRRHSAFTLIELLTTVAMITTLATLMTYAAHRVRQRSQAVRCANNLRQIGTSAMMHFIDYDIPSRIQWANTRAVELPGGRSAVLPGSVLMPLACFPDMPPLPERERYGGRVPECDQSPEPEPESETDPPPSPPRKPAPRTRIDGGTINAFGLLQKGCPGYEPNPMYELDPDLEPTYRSYGILRYNLGRNLDAAFEWIFACSNYDEIVCPSELAGARHRGKVNVFFSDGHSRLMAVEEIRFPEAE